MFHVTFLTYDFLNDEEEHDVVLNVLPKKSVLLGVALYRNILLKSNLRMHSFKDGKIKTYVQTYINHRNIHFLHNIMQKFI